MDWFTLPTALNEAQRIAENKHSCNYYGTRQLAMPNEYMSFSYLIFFRSCKQCCFRLLFIDCCCCCFLMLCLDACITFMRNKHMYSYKMNSLSVILTIKWTAFVRMFIFMRLATMATVTIWNPFNSFVWIKKRMQFIFWWTQIPF